MKTMKTMKCLRTLKNLKNIKIHKTTTMVISITMSFVDSFPCRYQVLRSTVDDDADSNDDVVCRCRFRYRTGARECFGHKADKICTTRRVRKTLLASARCALTFAQGRMWGLLQPCPRRSSVRSSSPLRVSHWLGLMTNGDPDGQRHGAFLRTRFQ